jgi:5'-3' exoribonuclease 1
LDLLGLCEGVQQDVYFPGFPTFKHVKHTAALEKAGVKVFQMPSRNNSIVLTLQTDYVDDNEMARLAIDWMNKECYIGWPHLLRALVIAVTTENSIYKLGEGGKFQHYHQRNADEWKRRAAVAANQYSGPHLCISCPLLIHRPCLHCQLCREKGSEDWSRSGAS